MRIDKLKILLINLFSVSCKLVYLFINLLLFVPFKIVPSNAAQSLAAPHLVTGASRISRNWSKSRRIEVGVKVIVEEELGVKVGVEEESWE